MGSEQLILCIPQPGTEVLRLYVHPYESRGDSLIGNESARHNKVY